jgi:hypothetical protein
MRKITRPPRRNNEKYSLLSENVLEYQYPGKSDPSLERSALPRSSKMHSPMLRKATTLLPTSQKNDNALKSLVAKASMTLL